MSDFRNSKTKDNLMRAFAGESQARNRYTMAEEKARQQKLYVLADLFKFTADQEKVHAKIFYEHLKELSGESVFVDGGYPVDISEDMCTLLGMADHNERQESEDVYPAFAEVARQEGYGKIAQDFTNIAKIENVHGKRFSAFGKLMKGVSLVLQRLMKNRIRKVIALRQYRFMRLWLNKARLHRQVILTLLHALFIWLHAVPTGKRQKAQHFSGRRMRARYRIF